MDAPAPPQFGRPEPGVDYRDRPAAFGIALRDGRIALVHVTTEGFTPWFDLPGGALDPGEDDPAAVAREFGEETGLKVTAGALVTRADQLFRMTDGEPVNNRTGIYAVEMGGLDPALKIEDDHELVWIDPQEALTLLRHDSHAWAVLKWMRASAA
jgi:8-oxo-dGTP diphosphatase